MEDNQNLKLRQNQQIQSYLNKSTMLQPLKELIYIKFPLVLPIIEHLAS